MRQRVTVLTLCVCVCVCLSVPRLLPSNRAYIYYKVDLPACFSSVFLGFQLTDLSEMPSFSRKSAFHSSIVVSNPHKRLCILLVVSHDHV